MIVTITDQAGTSGSVTIDAHDITERLAAWYPAAPAEVTEQIAALQSALLRDEDITGAAEYLAVTVERTEPGTVELPTAGMAQFVADIAGTATDTIVELTPEDLARLSAQPADHDGHFDGERIWVGGTEYCVEL